MANAQVEEIWKEEKQRKETGVDNFHQDREILNIRNIILERTQAERQESVSKFTCQEHNHQSSRNRSPEEKRNNLGKI